MAVHHAILNPLVEELEKDIRIAIVVADFNPDITHELLRLNHAYLEEQWFMHIDHYHVPGAFELPAITAQISAKSVYNLVIVIGCLIKWETPHFDLIAEAATKWLTDISMQFDTPIIFGLLTCNTLEQAKARVDPNYAIYGLNYVVQQSQGEHILEERYEELMEKMKDTMSALDSN